MTILDPPTPEDLPGGDTARATGSALRLRVSHPRSDAAVLSATGEVDETTVARFEELLAPRLLAAVRVVVLDLSDLEFLGVAGLQLLNQSYLRARDRNLALRVVATRRDIVRALHTADLNPLLGAYSTVAEALTADITEGGS